MTTEQQVIENAAAGFSFNNLMTRKIDKVLQPGIYKGKLATFTPSNNNSDFVKIVMEVDGAPKTTSFKLTEAWYDIFTRDMQNQFPNEDFEVFYNIIEFMQTNEVTFTVTETTSNGKRYLNWRFTKIDEAPELTEADAAAAQAAVANII